MTDGPCSQQNQKGQFLCELGEQVHKGNTVMKTMQFSVLEHEIPNLYHVITVCTLTLGLQAQYTVHDVAVR